MRFMDVQRKYDRLLGESIAYSKNLKVLEERKTFYETELIVAEKAQVIIQTVVQQTQQELQYKISELVSIALQSVFDDPYEFVVEFVQKRNKTECELRFVRRGVVIGNPMDSTGGGVVDVAAFALRLSLWSMQQHKSDPLIVLDEPFRFLSADLQHKTSELLCELAEKMNMQFLIVTHNDTLTMSADRVFRVRMRGGISEVVEEGLDND
jgi:ABC-type cobalamin/Fe3+-siderophores transport system ATPase subunit